jgi:hypothetical protein
MFLYCVHYQMRPKPLRAILSRVNTHKAYFPIYYQKHWLGRLFRRMTHKAPLHIKKSLEKSRLAKLGVKDSNLHKQIQSLLSYH